MWVAVSLLVGCGWLGRRMSEGGHSLVEVPGQEEVLVTQRQ
jgi:hypothetical protein